MRTLAVALACPGVQPCFTLPDGQMPQVAMGSWSGSYGDCASGDYACVQEHARFAAETWLRAGGAHLDAANDYRTQTSLAEALRTAAPGSVWDDRDKVFLTSKCPGAIGFEATIQCADDNLQMLGQFGPKGVQYLDLLLVHFPFIIKPVCRFHRDDPACTTMPFEAGTKAQIQDTWRAMEELKRIGVVKNIGLSDFNQTQVEWTLEVATEPIAVLQVEWNPSHHDDGLKQFCDQHGIRLQAWSPLGGAGGSVLGAAPVAQAAKSHNVSSAQVAVRWSLQQGVAVVVGSANAEHILGDLDVYGFNLTDAELASIAALQVEEAHEVVV